MESVREIEKGRKRVDISRLSRDNPPIHRKFIRTFVTKETSGAFESAGTKLYRAENQRLAEGFAPLKHAENGFNSLRDILSDAQKRKEDKDMFAILVSQSKAEDAIGFAMIRKLQKSERKDAVNTKVQSLGLSADQKQELYKIYHYVEQYLAKMPQLEAAKNPSLSQLRTDQPKSRTIHLVGAD